MRPLRQLTRMHSMELLASQLPSATFHDIAACTALTRMHLQLVTHATERDFHQLLSLTKLVDLVLRYHHPLPREAIAVIAQLPNLRQLSMLPVTGNSLTEAHLKEIAGCTQLLHLNLRGNAALGPGTVTRAQVGIPPGPITRDTVGRAMMQRSLDRAQFKSLKRSLGVMQHFMGMRQLQKLDLSFTTVSPLVALVTEFLMGWHGDVIVALNLWNN